MTTQNDNRTLVLFDVDGTLTKSRLPITPDMEQVLQQLHAKVDIGLVGGSDLNKICEQMISTKLANSNEQAIEQLVNTYDYVFAENGLIAYHQGKLIGKQSIVKAWGENNCQRLINFCLGYMSKLELPVKRGTFVEFRTGLINICPVGRSCTQEERMQFVAYEAEHKIREKMVEALRAEFPPELGLVFAIGGQISIDCYPIGWDKTYCLSFVENKYEKIYFFGDKTAPGGNDHEIFADARTIGHSVTDPEHTKRLLTELFLQDSPVTTTN